MKKIFAFILLVTPLLAAQNGAANEHVSAIVTSPDTIFQSGPADIVVLFTPREGIHINTVPVFEFHLEKNSPFELAGPPKFQKNEKGYLKSETPVTFSVKVKSGTRPGKNELKGSLTYFFCSDKEGWCQRYSQKVAATAEISK